MTNLVPGVLLKLLQHVNSDPKSITGERKSSLLQIVGIIPALSGGDLFKNNGFYIKVSDSSHAVYASLPEEHEDLILTDKIQLGQFIHVDRLQHASPFPLLCGVRPVPGRHPCVGTPLDLSSSEYVRKSATETNGGNKERSVAEKPDCNGKDEKLESRNPLPIKLKSKMSKSALIFVDKKVASVTSRSIPSSPSSLCSLPNSFEKFSVGLKQQGKIKGKVSPRYSSGTVDRVLSARGPSPSKGQVAPKKFPQCLEIEAKASRKSWEGMIDCRSRESPKLGVLKQDQKSETRNTSVQRRNPPTCDKLPIKENKVQQSSAKSPPHHVNKISAASKTGGGIRNCDEALHLSTKRATLSGKKSTLGISNECPLSNLVKVHPNKKGSHTNAISWTSIPSSLARLGKEVLKQKEAAQSAAIDAIQEASAAESLLRCLSIYTDLASSAKGENPQPAIDGFLNLHASLGHARVVSHSLSSSHPPDDPDPGPSEEMLKVSLDRRKQATAWVRAAVSADLSPFTVFTKPPVTPGGNRPVLVLENHSDPENGAAAKIRQRSGSGPQRRIQKGVPLEYVRGGGGCGGGGGEGVELAETMGTESRDWFLKFVEEFLDADLDPSTTLADSGQVAGMLSRLKNVDDWLGEVGHGDGVPSPLADTTDRLRKKIYGYLLTHVESAAAAAAVGGGLVQPPTESKGKR